MGKRSLGTTRKKKHHRPDGHVREASWLKESSAIRATKRGGGFRSGTKKHTDGKKGRRKKRLFLEEGNQKKKMFERGDETKVGSKDTKKKRSERLRGHEVKKRALLLLPKDEERGEGGKLT